MALPVIAITNVATCLTDLEVNEAIPSLQKQITDDLNAYWNLDATLTFLPKGETLTPGWWRVLVMDEPDVQNALGYHDLTPEGFPQGKVFAALDIRSNSSWTVTLSHELIELRGDPWCNLAAQGSDGKLYAFELADATEDDSLAYKIGDVLVSDFVLPSWFEPTESPLVDFKKLIHKPFELAPGGYVSIYDNGQWKQLTAQRFDGKMPPQEIPIGSRRYRRRLPRSEWKRSAQ